MRGEPWAMMVLTPIFVPSIFSPLLGEMTTPAERGFIFFGVYRSQDRSYPAIAIWLSNLMTAVNFPNTTLTKTPPSTGVLQIISEGRVLVQHHHSSHDSVL